MAAVVSGHYGGRTTYGEREEDTMKDERLLCDMTADEQMIRRIVRHYGQEDQLSQAMEEAGELITAISHYRRRRKGSRRELLEEMADMQIMLRQLQLITGAGSEELEALEHRKLLRQAERMRSRD